MRGRRVHHRERCVRQVVHVHRLTLSVGAPRQHEKTHASPHRRDACQRLVASRAIDQRRTQHCRRRPVGRGGIEDEALRHLQARDDVAFVGVGRRLLRIQAGGTERDHASRGDLPARIPLREAVQRPGAEDHVDSLGKSADVGELAGQPGHPTCRWTRHTRHREHLPSPARQPRQQRLPDLATGTEHQRRARRRIRHPGGRLRRPHRSVAAVRRPASAAARPCAATAPPSPSGAH